MEPAPLSLIAGVAATAALLPPVAPVVTGPVSDGMPSCTQAFIGVGGGSALVIVSPEVCVSAWRSRAVACEMPVLGVVAILRSTTSSTSIFSISLTLSTGYENVTAAIIVSILRPRMQHLLWLILFQLVGG